MRLPVDICSVKLAAEVGLVNVYEAMVREWLEVARCAHGLCVLALVKFAVYQLFQRIACHRSTIYQNTHRLGFASLNSFVLVVAGRFISRT